MFKLPLQRLGDICRDFLSWKRQLLKLKLRSEKLSFKEFITLYSQKEGYTGYCHFVWSARATSSSSKKQKKWKRKLIEYLCGINRGKTREEKEEKEVVAKVKGKRGREECFLLVSLNQTSFPVTVNTFHGKLVILLIFTSGYL